jgi:hypothetical protein
VRNTVVALDAVTQIRTPNPVLFMSEIFHVDPNKELIPPIVITVELPTFNGAVDATPTGTPALIICMCTVAAPVANPVTDGKNPCTPPVEGAENANSVTSRNSVVDVSALEVKNPSFPRILFGLTHAEPGEKGTAELPDPDTLEFWKVKGFVRPGLVSTEPTMKSQF